MFFNVGRIRRQSKQDVYYTVWCKLCVVVCNNPNSIMHCNILRCLLFIFRKQAKIPFNKADKSSFYIMVTERTLKTA